MIDAVIRIDIFSSICARLWKLSTGKELPGDSGFCRIVLDAFDVSLIVENLLLLVFYYAIIKLLLCI